MDRLHGPFAFDEARRKIVEQLRMSRPLTQLSEIAYRAYDASAEVVLPDAID